MCLLPRQITLNDQAVPVDLESVPQSRLDHTLTVTYFVNQPVDITDLIIIDATEVRGNHRTDEEAAEPWSRVDREHHVTERDTSRRHRWPCVPDLEFGKEHGDKFRRTGGATNGVLGPTRSHQSRCRRARQRQP